MKSKSSGQLTLAVIAGLICLVTYGLHVENKPFFATSIAGAFLIHMWARPGRREARTTVILGALLAGMYALAWPPARQGLTAVLLSGGAWLGVGSLLVMASDALRLEGAERKAKWALFYPAVLLSVSSIIGSLGLLSTSYFHPRTYDMFLYAFDSGLGLQPSFAVGRVFLEWPALTVVAKAVYTGVPLAIALLYANQITAPRPSQTNILFVFFGTGFAGLFLYHFFPATGPLFVFGSSFPNDPPPVDSSAVSLFALQSEAPRNAMPSVHTAWALLVWWNSRRMAVWVRTLAGLFLLFTIVGTLGLGEHYLIDLAVAVPFTVALQAAFTTDTPFQAQRRPAVAAGIAVLIFWLIALRLPGSLSHSPVFSWGAILCTTVPFLILEKRLADRWQGRALSGPLPCLIFSTPSADS